MKLIVGLGNPGEEYEFTPHNLGFLAIDRVARRYGAEVRNRQSRALTGRATIGSEQVLLIKPETFMNLSGLSVGDLVSKLNLKPEADVIVLHDELDFPFGTVRLRQRGSSAGHNGIESIIGALGTQEFMRIRLGVAPEHKLSEPKNYLLAPMRKSQMGEVELMLDTATDAVEAILQEGAAAAMNRFNRKAEPAGE